MNEPVPDSMPPLLPTCEHADERHARLDGLRGDIYELLIGAQARHDINSLELLGAIEAAKIQWFLNCTTEWQALKIMVKEKDSDA